MIPFILNHTSGSSGACDSSPQIKLWPFTLPSKLSNSIIWVFNEFTGGSGVIKTLYVITICDWLHRSQLTSLV